MPFRGSLLVLGLPPAPFLWCALFTGHLGIGRRRSQVQAYQFGMLVSFLPGFLLSGFTFSIDTMPKVIQGFSYFFPARYFVTIVKGVFLKGIDFRILGANWDSWCSTGAHLLAAVKKMNQKVA